MLHQRRGFALAWRLIGHRWAPVVTLVATGLVLHFLPPVLLGWPNLIVHSLMAASVASLAIRENSVLAPVMQARPIAHIGRISYGLYIWHLVGLHIGVETAKALGLGGWSGVWVAMLVYVPAAIVIAELSFRYFETYFSAPQGQACARRAIGAAGPCRDGSRREDEVLVVFGGQCLVIGALPGRQCRPEGFVACGDGILRTDR